MRAQTRLDRQAIREELAVRRLRHFVPFMWSVIEPGTPLAWNWHLDAICDHLEAVTRGDIRNLVINIPPRSLKSTITSVMWPAWSWLQRPSSRWLTGSYIDTLSTRDAVRSRRLMQSSRYQRLLRRPGGPAWDFASDQNVKSRYENTATGHRIGTSPGGGGTGDGGDIVLVDDPHNVKRAESDAQRQAAIDWWFETMSSRGNDPKKVAFVVVMQRLHHADLTAECLARGYEHLCLPTLYERDHAYRSRTSLGFIDPRTEDGEMLHEARMGPAEIAAAQTALGSWGFASQHQQRPSPRGGAIFRLPWFRLYRAHQRPHEFDRIVTSWDLSFKGEDDSRGRAAELQRVTELSWVVGQVWGFRGADSYLLDEARGRWDIVEAIKQILQLHSRWPQATRHLIEDKANGPAVLRILRSEVPGLTPIEPDGSKIQRAIACQPYVEAGNVWVPHPDDAPWIGGGPNPPPESWLGEVTSFPMGLAADRVDAMTQVLIHQHIGDGNAGRLLELLSAW